MKITKRQLKRIIRREATLLEKWSPADAAAAQAAADARGPDLGYLQNLWNNAANNLDVAAKTAWEQGLDPDYAELMADMNELVDKAFKISKALNDEADKQ